MNTHADKTQDRKSSPVANSFPQKKSDNKFTFQFVNNRQEAIAQRKLQAMANNSLQSKGTTQLQAKTNSPCNIVTQRQENLGSNTLQLKVYLENRKFTPIANAPVQFGKWLNKPGENKTKSQLSRELRAGVNAVVASPIAAPNPLPGWIRARVRQSLNYTATRASIPANAAQQVNNQWARIPPRGQQAIANTQGIVTWRLQRINQRIQQMQNALDNQVTANLHNRIPEFKWCENFANNDGFLPGTRGAGGYKEYYAKPARTDPPTTGFWGSNRVLRRRTGTIFVTADHYQNFVRVTDA